MSQTVADTRSIGTYTVLDIMLFVAACSVSSLLIRELRPEAATWDDYLKLTFYCGPAGLSAFGPWAVRRQFLEGAREELWPGEWLWIALGAGWLAATPMILAVGVAGVYFFTACVAVAVSVPALVATIQSLSGPLRKPWTHWVGIVLALLHAAPALFEIGPLVWSSIERALRIFACF